MKHSQEYEAFTALTDRILDVPHSVLKERIEAERKRIAADPNRPGPKPKKRKAVKPPAS